jgi:predicted DCC family thiol-disulfide oxidoreductase YuxK
MNPKYMNINIVIDEVISVVDDYVNTKIDDKARQYIQDSDTTYEVLDEVFDEKNLFKTVMKIVSGLSDNMFEMVREEGIFTINNYDLDLQTALSKLVYTHYFHTQ